MFQTAQKKSAVSDTKNEKYDSHMVSKKNFNLLSNKQFSVYSPINPLLHLQQTIGNQAVQRLVHSGIIQTKLKVSQPDDIYEQEADRVAEEVMRMSSTSLESNTPLSDTTDEKLYRNCKSCKDEEEEKMTISRKASSVDSSSNLQTSDNNIKYLTENLHRGGSALDSSIREFMESHFGFDFSKVRIHTDEKAAKSSLAVNALAFTTGNNIAFGKGQYTPTTEKGKRLIAHELTHVIQQSTDTSRNHLYMKADPAAVAKMDAATILKHPNYIDNNLKKMSFFGAEMAILYYADGTSLEIGLVPRWIKPPLETVDYHSTRSEYAEVIDPKGKKLKFVPHPLEIPVEHPSLKGLSFQEVIGAFGKTVSFSVEPNSGKIIPNHLNAITAPFLCTWLRNVEGEYVKNTDAIAKGTVKVLTVLKLIVELSLFRATLGGPKTVKVPTGGVLTRTGTVTVEKAIESGLVKESGKLVSVLRGIQRAFVKKPPGSVGEGLSIVSKATTEVGLEAGVVAKGGLQQGYLVLKNVGGVSTEILSTGEIIVTRGKDVLLRLIP